MLQSFDDFADPSLGPQRLKTLRAELARRRLDGFLVPRADEHQNEYVPPNAERLFWLTGFSGSAGLAIALKDTAAIFVDGRYTIQVRQQVDPDAFQIKHLIDEPPARWLEHTLEPKARLGYDPWLHTVAEAERLTAACNKAGAKLVACQTNPLDAVWRDQPPPPRAKAFPQPLKFAGERAADKLARMAKKLAAADVDATVLTLPDSIAWLLNIRGRDLPRTPFALSFAILKASGEVELFIDPQKLSAKLRSHLPNRVSLRQPDDLGEALDRLAGSGATVQLDAATAPQWIWARLAQAGAKAGAKIGAKPVRGADPCVLAKASKNEAEIAGAKRAHLRDGVAVCRFLAWLARHATSGDIDEIDAAAHLERLRAAGEEFQDLSFDTISAVGPNAALSHYRVTRSTNLPLRKGVIYLCDSGGQYRDGTTDITRTIIVGAPTDEMRDRFTRVLKGHIAIATARFPKGTTGAQIDAFARRALWDAGLDFDHGTGHGVGSFLSVHEGPARISKAGHVALKPGMILSNEPGYYKAGAYGIRIENLEIVCSAERIPGGDRDMLRFEALTLAPIDRKLIETALLNANELAWLDAYHTRVWRKIGPLLERQDKDWLRAATEPLAPRPTMQ